MGTQFRAHPPIFGPCLLWPNGQPSQQLLSSCFVSSVSELTPDRASSPENEPLQKIRAGFYRLDGPFLASRQFRAVKGTETTHPNEGKLTDWT